MSSNFSAKLFTNTRAANRHEKTSVNPVAKKMVLLGFATFISFLAGCLFWFPFKYTVLFLWQLLFC